MRKRERRRHDIEEMTLSNHREPFWLTFRTYDMSSEEQLPSDSSSSVVAHCAEAKREGDRGISLWELDTMDGSAVKTAIR
jgi:hypothetical protein